jgi:hypothetical protein
MLIIKGSRLFNTNNAAALVYDVAEFKVYLVIYAKLFTGDVIITKSSSNEIMHTIEKEHHIPIFSLIRFELMPVLKNALPGMPCHF